MDKQDFRLRLILAVIVFFALFVALVWEPSPHAAEFYGPVGFPVPSEN
jgi:hypothetical protein